MGMNVTVTDTTVDLPDNTAAKADAVILMMLLIQIFISSMSPSS